MTDAPSPYDPSSEHAESKVAAEPSGEPTVERSRDEAPVHEIPLQTPPLDGLLPKSPPEPPRRPPSRLRKIVLMLGVSIFLVLGILVVWPTGDLPDPPGGALSHLIDRGADWRYLDDGTDPGPNWFGLDFDDSHWPSGHALFGYGKGDETTVLRCRPDWPTGEPCPKGGDDNRILTHYFRHSFQVEDPSVFDRSRLSMLKDDGAVVYLNGEAIIRANMSPGVSGWNQPAAHEAETDRTWFDYHLDLRKLVAGRNVIAVELHQASPAGEDLAFDLQATAFDPYARAVRRGPYLQQTTSTSVTLRWRTADRIPSIVRWGTSEDSLDNTVSQELLTREHSVQLDGLDPDTTYTYALGDEDQTLLSGKLFRFTTAPSSETSRPVRIWAVGDQGTGDSLARKVKLGFLKFTADRPPDLWLSLGDNAYDDGTDREFQRALFDTYGDLLSGLNLWPSLGNHDLKALKDGKGPYFNIFELPTGGEAGGVASGTEAYYSIDYGPIHLISLDTAGGDLRPGRDMLTWLEQDLDAGTSPWTIVYFHHPPYTDGWHRSDDPKKGWRMTAVRENVLPILEDAGVDLVLAGHSHSYERSYLLYGHYGTSETLTDAMKLDAGDGRLDGSGPYTKRRGGRGTVYVVAGSSGKLATGKLEHPAMVTSLSRLGSLVIDIDGDQLDLAFVDDNGRALDRFRLIHR